MSMRNITHGLNANHALLDAVMALDIEKRDGFICNAFFDILGMDLIRLANLDGDATAQTNHRWDRCSVIDGMALLQDHLVCEA